MIDLAAGCYVATPAERMWLLADYVVAGRPLGPTSGFGIQHLFRRPGEWSLCDAVDWLRVVRCDPVNECTWICTRCQAEGVAIRVELGACPACRAPLTDPSRSPGGWAHCRACRRGWLVVAHDGLAHPVGRDWPAREGAVA